MYVTLLTTAGHIVKRFVIAPFQALPDVLIWGNRAFMYSDDVFANIENADDGMIHRGVRCHNYKECFTVDVGPSFSSKEWEPYTNE